MSGELRTEPESSPVPWDWREKVLDFLKPETRLLLMFPIDGRFLFSLGHTPALCTALVRRGTRLSFAPGGIGVSEGAPEEPLPFPDGSFDLILADFVPYSLPEISRVLTPGGFFLTRQAGSEDSLALRRILGLKPAAEKRNCNLENELPRFLEAGFRVMYRNQAYPVTRFFSTEELEKFLSERPLQFPGVPKAQLPLLRVQLQEKGFLENEEHLFLMIGKK